MNAIVIGAGRMGRAIASDFKTAGFGLHITDSNEAAGRALAKALGARFTLFDASKPGSLRGVLEGADVAVSAVPYFFNLGLAAQAVRQGVHFCDLGGNEGVVHKELKLDGAARKRGVCLTPDCGLAPGMVSFLVAWGMTRFDRVDKVRVRVGGLPQKPKGPLKYQMVFSIHGLINEYRGLATLLRGGKIAKACTMTGLETIDWPGVGELEAFHTSGGSSTLPYTFKGRVGDLDYKTLRFPGHCARMRALMKKHKPDALAKHLEATLPPTGPDQVFVLVDIEGRGKIRRWTLRMRDRETGGFTSMMRTTGFPAAIVAQLMATGRVKRKGALIQERDFDPAEFVGELRKRKIPFTVVED